MCKPQFAHLPASSVFSDSFRSFVAHPGRLMWCAGESKETPPPEEDEDIQEVNQFASIPPARCPLALPTCRFILFVGLC
jgi:hypothetical protein